MPISGKNCTRLQSCEQGTELNVGGCPFEGDRWPSELQNWALSSSGEVGHNFEPVISNLTHSSIGKCQKNPSVFLICAMTHSKYVAFGMEISALRRTR